MVHIKFQMFSFSGETGGTGLKTEKCLRKKGPWVSGSKGGGGGK